MYQCRFNDGNKCTPALPYTQVQLPLLSMWYQMLIVGEVVHVCWGEGTGSIWEFSIISVQSYCEPKTIF